MMEEQMIETKLVEAIDKIVAWVENTEAFVAAQAPDVVQQYLEYARYVATVKCFGFTIMGVLLIAACAFGAHAFNLNESKRDRSFCVAAWTLIGSLAASFFFIPAVSNYFTLVKVDIAPKVLILEKLADLL